MSMSIFSFFIKNTNHHKNVFREPWDKNRESIFSFIDNHTAHGQCALPEEKQILPDDEIFYKGKGLRWASGGLDGNRRFWARSSKEDQVKRAKDCLSALTLITKRPTEVNIATFYNFFLQDNTIDFIDELITLILHARNLDFNKIEKFALFLATKSPDRGPVKVGIAILGIFSGDAYKNIFYTLGLHEEFTLFSAVAIKRTSKTPELDLWKLAKNIHGWGRISIVEHLAETKNADIQQWMLRDGYKNTIMYEYLAYICATAGNLLYELQQHKVDDSLLLAAGDLIGALLQGGPAQNIDDYSDGSEVVRLYVNHVSQPDKNLYSEQFLVLEAIRNFVSNEEDNREERAKKGWSEDLRNTITYKIAAILGRPEWEEKIKAELESRVDSKEYKPFHVAALVAQELGIATWGYYYKRQQMGVSDEWYYLMQTEDTDKIDKALALAEIAIPLDEIATGPADELGIGNEFKYHQALDFIVQGLKRFPGKGWKFIKTSLRSPAIRNRNVAIKALSIWGKENWPDEAESLLAQSLNDEIKMDVKERIQRLINGEAID